MKFLPFFKNSGWAGSGQDHSVGFFDLSSSLTKGTSVMSLLFQSPLKEKYERVLAISGLMLKWKLSLFKGQGYINRVIPVSGWFVLTSICWTWWRMTRSGSRRRTAAPIEGAGGILRKVRMRPLLSSGLALSFHKWNCKEQFIIKKAAVS